MAPDGNYYQFDSKPDKYTYSDGKSHNGQQKKAGVWTITNKEGNFMWNNAKKKYVLNTSDRSGGENSFPLVGKPGTTYAGGDNPRNRITGQDDYSQPPQNIADYGGYVHDKEYDRLGLKGPNGTLSPLSTIANNRLIQFSSLVVDMYNNGKTDPFTGAPVSKLTYEAALNIISAFRAIESKKK